MMDNLNLTPEQRRRKVFAELLSQQGQEQQATDIYGGLSKLGSQLIGAYLKSKTTKDEAMVEENRNKAYAAALKGDTSQVAEFDPKFALNMQDRAEDKQYRNEMLELKRQDMASGGASRQSVIMADYRALLEMGYPAEEAKRLATLRHDPYAKTGDTLRARAEFGAGATQAEETGKQQAKTQFEPEREFLKTQAKAQGEVAASLQAQESKLPNLERVVDRLSELGQKATYTTAGRLKDTATRELGLDVGEGAVAREEYISIVNNQILPLLRDTFGAQFTEREGESLKATLGSPNVSPKEKDAVLRSFIEQKKRNIEDLRRQTSQQPNVQFMGFE